MSTHTISNDKQIRKISNRVFGNKHMDAKVIAPQCLEKNVAYVPGGSFFPNGGKENHFRLNYSCMPEDKIVEGITKIAEVLKANLK